MGWWVYPLLYGNNGSLEPGTYLPTPPPIKKKSSKSHDDKMRARGNTTFCSLSHTSEWIHWDETNEISRFLVPKKSRKQKESKSRSYFFFTKHFWIFRDFSFLNYPEKNKYSTGWCSTPTLLLICSSFSRENGYPLLICSSLSTPQSRTSCSIKVHLDVKCVKLEKTQPSNPIHSSADQAPHWALDATRPFLMINFSERFHTSMILKESVIN